MAKSKKFYVVWVGNSPGVFDSWTACQLSIKGYPGAKYKSFKTRAAAEAAFSDDLNTHIDTNVKTKKVLDPAAQKAINWESLAVDAACSGNPGIMEYQGVDTKTGLQFFHQGPFNGGTNNVGEFLALVHALAYLQKKGNDSTPIYSDSRTAMAWVRKRKANTKLAKTPTTKILWELIARAEKWLRENHYKNEIIKWKTEEWGEIPADFGRK